MLTKLLLTLSVIIVVALVYRHKRNDEKPLSHEQVLEQADEYGALSTRAVAYIILGVLLVISATVFVIKY